MKQVLTKGLDKGDVAEMKQAFVSAKPLRDQLIKILMDRIETERKNSTLKSNYENPSWALSQADTIGAERKAREIIALLED